MPFTLSHAVLAPPISYLTGNRLPVAALAIGSMVPDLHRLFTHTNSNITHLPKVQNLAQRVAAPLNSDSTAQAQAKLSWESQVKGMLNRVKRYPADAKRRQRSGAPVVSFVVDAQGRVADVVLKTPSATASLDREALAVILRAQPLPSPPAEMLRQGKIAVTMAVDFNLALL